MLLLGNYLLPLPCKHGENRLHLSNSSKLDCIRFAPSLPMLFVIQERYMSKYEIPFLTACIQAFGKRFDMTRQAAFRYLHEHKGLAFLIEFYDVEHLQSMDETIDDLLIICQKNGGTLA